VGLQAADEESYFLREEQESKRELGQEFERMVIGRISEMYHRLGASVSEQTLQGMMAAVKAIVELDKSPWLSYRGQVAEAELLAIERLQSMFREHSEPLLLSRLLKGFFLLPPVRELIVRDIPL
jgi:hypothetical protein